MEPLKVTHALVLLHNVSRCRVVELWRGPPPGASSGVQELLGSGAPSLEQAHEWFARVGGDPEVAAGRVRYVAVGVEPDGRRSSAFLLEPAFGGEQPSVAHMAIGGMAAFGIVWLWDHIDDKRAKAEQEIQAREREIQARERAEIRETFARSRGVDFVTATTPGRRKA